MRQNNVLEAEGEGEVSEAEEEAPRITEPNIRRHPIRDRQPPPRYDDYETNLGEQRQQRRRHGRSHEQ